MSRVLSFAWTSPALLAGRKTCTRRQWSPNYARSIRPGEIMTAYDRSPRIGGKPIATIRIESVTWEPDADAPDSDYGAEGFAFLYRNPELLPKGQRVAYLLKCSRGAFNEWRRAGGSSWVVRFSVLDTEAAP